MSAYTADLPNALDERSGSDANALKTSAPSARITSVLSASYADSDVREALRTLDRQNLQNTPETRRRFRLDVQKEVIQRNGMIIQDFGHVAEVRAHYVNGDPLWRPRAELWTSNSEGSARPCRVSMNLARS